MVYVSKRPMSRKVAENVHTNFIRALFPSVRSRHAREILEALLTKSEKVMLAKRLAIVVMLHNEYTYENICNTLKVSASTVTITHRKLLAGAFDPILSTMSGRTRRTVMENIELILAAGLPSIAGPKHQHRLNRLRRKQ
jgi:Trp operon repressor